MPSCIDCGAYTKYSNGRCFRCYRKHSKSGFVYLAEVTFRDGKKKVYTGQTRRTVFERVGEHMRAQMRGDSRTYTGRGTFFRLLGSIFSTNRYKAERTVKRLPRHAKLSLAKKGAMEFMRSKRT